MRWRGLIGGVTAAALLVAGCAGGMMGEKKAPLYDRLGGRPAIQAVVDDFIGNVAADARINNRFAGAPIGKLKTNLVDQICEATGGPCKYTGQNMKSVHAGMQITDAEFDALVEDLSKSLDKLKVAEAEKGELLTALGKMRKDVVGQ
jgi:hemoglobin